MKKYKRPAALLLALVLALSFAACGNKVSGTVSPNDEPEESVTGSITADGPDASPEASPSASPEASSSPDASAGAEDGGEYQTGSVNGGTYTNSFISIGCDLDSNWTYYSEDKIMEMNGLVMDSIKDEDIAEKLKNSSVIYDMYASADQGLETINVCFENLGVLYGITMDESEYIDASMDSLTSTLESAGFSDVSSQKTTVQFAGAERNAIYIEATADGYPVYEEVVCIKQGNYMADITFACYTQNILPNLMALFYAL